MNKREMDNLITRLLNLDPESAMQELERSGLDTAELLSLIQTIMNDEEIPARLKKKLFTKMAAHYSANKAVVHHCRKYTVATGGRDPVMLYKLAQRYYLKDKIEQAERYALQILDIDENWKATEESWKAVVLYLNILRKKGSFQKVIDLCGEYYSRDNIPESVMDQIEIAHCFAQLDNYRIEQRIEDFEEAEELFHALTKRSAEGYFGLVFLYDLAIKVGHMKKSLEVFAKMAKWSTTGSMISPQAKHAEQATEVVASLVSVQKKQYCSGVRLGKNKNRPHNVGERA